MLLCNNGNRQQQQTYKNIEILQVDDDCIDENKPKTIFNNSLRVPSNATTKTGDCNSGITSDCKY